MVEQKRLPYFPFYASDYLGSSSVQVMSPMEEWAYLRLLIYSGDAGSIPGDLKGIAAICKNTPLVKMKALWDAISHKFEPHPELAGRLINRKMEDIRTERVAFHESKSRAGKLGNEKKQQLKETAQRSANGTHSETQRSTQSERKRDAEATANTTAKATPPLPSPLPKNSSPVDNSHIPGFVRPVERVGDRASVQDPDRFQKYWGPVEQGIRKGMVEDVFLAYYAGCRVLNMTGDGVVLAVPGTLLDRNGRAENTQLIMENHIERCREAGYDLLRGRALTIVNLDEIEEEQL